MGLNNINSKSTWGQAASDINTNFTTIDSDLKKVKNATTRNKGYFSTSSELISAFPTASKGDIAYVGSSYPYDIWKWNGGSWAKSGSTGGEESVNLGNYYTKVETDEKFTEADAKLSELGSEVAHNTIISSSTSEDNYIFKERNWEVVQGYAISGNSGAASAQSAYSYLLVNVEKYRGKTIKYARMVHEDSSQNLWGIGFYRSKEIGKDNVISSYGSITGEYEGYTEMDILVPEDAVYGAFTFFTRNIEGFYVKLSVGLDEQVVKLNQSLKKVEQEVFGEVFNQFNSEVVQGYAISTNSGAASAQSAYSYLKIDVSKYRGQTIKYARMVHEEGNAQGLWGVCIYNNDTVSKDSAILKSGSIYGSSDGYIEAELIVPNNAVCAAFTFFADDSVGYFYVKASEGLIDKVGGIEQREIEIQLPTETVAVVGHEWNLFYQNICPNYQNKGVFFSGDIVGDGGYSARRLHTIPTESNVGDNNVSLNVMNDTVKTIETIAEQKIPIHVVADSPTRKNIVFIGDSLTDAAVYAAEIEHNLSHGKYHSIGTRSGKNNKGSVSYNDNTYEVLHEGRSGWKFLDYTSTQTSSDGVLNPFYNPSTGEFDFSYYMQTYQQSIGKIDAVCLNLGTNDQASYASRFSKQVTAINKMIDSIHSYDSDVKVLIWLAPNNANGSNNRLFKIRMGILRDVLMDKFGKRTDNVFLTDVFIGIDGDYDFTCDGAEASARNPQKVDEYSAYYGLHPNNYGYLHIADCLYAHLLYRLEV